MNILGDSDFCKSLQDCVEEKMDTSAQFIREKPWPAVVWAVAIGYLLHLLPLARITGLLFKAIISLLKPLAVLWLIGKIWEKASARKSLVNPVTENPPEV